MSRRTQTVVLAVLLGILALVVYASLGQGPKLGSVLFANERFEPLGVADPTLRFDLLERVRKLEYTGPKRNIFVATRPPPPVNDKPKVQQPVGPALPPAPPPEPPLVIPFKFYGYAVDPGTGRRRAFFTDGDNVFILREGESLQNRFRLLRIGNESAELEETASGRRATVPLEQLPGATP